MATYQVPADKNARLGFAFKTSQGKDAQVQADSIKVTSSDETVAKLSIIEQNIFIDTQSPGSSTGTLSADADLGAGVVEVSATFTIEVTGLNADRIELTAALVLEDKPPVA